MSFLKNLGASIGIGNLTVTVDCEPLAHQGEAIRGAATITGGDVPQLVQGLEARVLHHWEVYDEERRQNVERSEVIHRRRFQFHGEVQPGGSYTAPFELDVPVGLVLAAAGEWHSVQIEADISGGVDVRGSRPLALWPVRPIADTLRAVAMATGWTLAGYQPRKARSGFVRAVLTPSPVFAQRFDRLILELSLNQGAMHVYATVDLKEGIWKTITGGDEHDYRFAATQIPEIVANVQALIHKHAYA